MSNNLKMPYNVAYLNWSLIDELDYVVGGYGLPNQSFIFSLNSFIESYVLNDVFHFSVLEWNHYMTTNKSILSDGRPIFKILFDKGDKILFRDWTGYFKGFVLYSKPVNKAKDEIQYCIDDFQKTASKEIKAKYFKPSIFLEPNQKYQYITRNFGFNIIPEHNYLIYAVERSQS